jgi:hypothetical protein
VRARTENVPAWHVSEGDRLPGDVTVLAVYREPVGRTVRIVTDEPASADLPAGSPVAVVRG